MTSVNWGCTAAGYPDKKQTTPQKQLHEMRAALEFNGMQAADIIAPIITGSNDGRAPSRSRARTEKDVDGITSS